MQTITVSNCRDAVFMRLVAFRKRLEFKDARKEKK